MLTLCVLTFLVPVPSAHLVSVLSTPRAEGQKRIELAIADFHYYTCVRWRVRSSKDKAYVTFSPSDACNAQVGRAGGKQLINLDKYCLEHKLSILHEMLHAIGFYHEHQRPDRDDYITINKTTCGFQSLTMHYDTYPCAKLQSMPPESVYFPYDYCSVMHYSINVWPSDKSIPVIKATRNLPPCMYFGGDGFSEIDVQKINKWFNCQQPKGIVNTVARIAEDIATGVFKVTIQHPVTATLNILSNIPWFW